MTKSISVGWAFGNIRFERIVLRSWFLSLTKDLRELKISVMYLLYFFSNSKVLDFSNFKVFFLSKFYFFSVSKFSNEIDGTFLASSFWLSEFDLTNKEV